MFVFVFNPCNLSIGVNLRFSQMAHVAPLGLGCMGFLYSINMSPRWG